MSESYRYKSMLIKVSGESMFQFSEGVDIPKKLQTLIDDLTKLHYDGVGLGLVVGGGNLARGRDMVSKGISRLTADQVGMLSTCINGIVLCELLKQKGLDARVFSAFSLGQMVPEFSQDTALSYVKSGGIAIFVGGTGNPLVSTDSAASLRAVELNMDIMVKMTQVDGVYDADPHVNQQAKKITHLTYSGYIEKKLSVMDLQAVKHCEMFDIPIVVCHDAQSGVLLNIAKGVQVGTKIGS